MLWLGGAVMREVAVTLQRPSAAEHPGSMPTRTSSEAAFQVYVLSYCFARV